jgi:hypothetical protein
MTVCDGNLQGTAPNDRAPSVSPRYKKVGMANTLRVPPAGALSAVLPPFMSTASRALVTRTLDRDLGEPQHERQADRQQSLLNGRSRG